MSSLAAVTQAGNSIALEESIRTLEPTKLQEFIAHFSHSLAPSFGPTNPVGHNLQYVPSLPYLPTAHLTHFKSSGPGAVGRYPNTIGHAILPATQFCRLVEPFSLVAPVGHFLQSSIFVNSTVLEYWPLGQSKHSLRDLSPKRSATITSGANLPAGHATGSTTP
tara:strand:- start:398 stop:889 length:492 start_codon:yes stop_codon:yes gene_type:complete